MTGARDDPEPLRLDVRGPGAGGSGGGSGFGGEGSGGGSGFGGEGSGGGSGFGGARPDADYDETVRAGGVVTSRRKWALLIAAFVLGGAVSLIVVDARRSIEERTALDVVLGAQELTPSPTAVEYAVRNVGPRPVDILHIVPVGWNLTDDPDRAVTVAPDEWVAVTTAVEADCDVRPDATAQVTARAESGEQSVGTTLSPGANNDLLAAWAQACPVRPLVEISGGFAEPPVATDEVLTGVVWVEPHGSEDRIRIVDLDSRNAGFLASSEDLPVDVPVGGRSEVSVEWRVIDCGQAARMTSARLDVTIATPEPRAFRVDITLDTSATLALARFSGSFCGT